MGARLSAGDLAELRRRRNLHDLLDRGWIQHSTAGRAVSAVLALGPAFDRRSRGVGGVGAEAGRVVALLLRP